MSKPFNFKKFTISQKLNSQKVGTDSMLLGAWVEGNFHSILDIGTGTGILALMMAQKFEHAKIVAIEPEEFSFQEAKENFERSIFKNSITSFCATLQNFKSQEKFDLIISNPPYFSNSTLSKNQSKNNARHNLHLNFDDLIEYAVNLLSDQGIIAVIVPAESQKSLLEISERHHLYPNKILHTIKDDRTKVRSLIQLTKSKPQNIDMKEMIVKHSDNTYSAEYIEMTKDFYGKDLKGIIEKSIRNS